MDLRPSPEPSEGPGAAFSTRGASTPDALTKMRSLNPSSIGTGLMDTLLPLSRVFSSCDTGKANAVPLDTLLSALNRNQFVHDLIGLRQLWTGSAAAQAFAVRNLGGSEDYAADAIAAFAERLLKVAAQSRLANLHTA